MAIIDRTPTPATNLTRSQRDDLALVVNEWPYPAAILDRDGGCLLANLAYAEATGRSHPDHDTASPTPINETVHPKDLPHLRELLARVRQDDSTHSAELRVRHARGDYLTWWWEVSRHPQTQLILVRVAQPK